MDHFEGVVGPGDNPSLLCGVAGIGVDGSDPGTNESLLLCGVAGIGVDGSDPGTNESLLLCGVAGTNESLCCGVDRNNPRRIEGLR